MTRIRRLAGLVGKGGLHVFAAIQCNAILLHRRLLQLGVLAATAKYPLSASAERAFANFRDKNVVFKHFHGATVISDDLGAHASIGP